MRGSGEVEGRAGLQGLLLYSFLSLRKAHTHKCTDKHTREIRSSTIFSCLKLHNAKKVVGCSVGFSFSSWSCFSCWPQLVLMHLVLFCDCCDVDFIIFTCPLRSVSFLKGRAAQTFVNLLTMSFAVNSSYNKNTTSKKKKKKAEWNHKKEQKNNTGTSLTDIHAVRNVAAVNICVISYSWITRT